MATQKAYLLAGLTAILLYVVGVFTGAMIYTYTESKTSQEFARLHDEIRGYEKELESVELEQLYLASGQGELGCKFVVSSLSRIQSDLDYFWTRLPQKLEVYEKYNPPDEEYEALKEEYMALSLKTWLLSLSVRDKCGEDIFPILYFYSRECEDCIEQGEVLDRIRQDNRTLVYTVDLNLGLDAIRMVRDAYGIDTTPSLVIGDEAYQGLVSYSKLLWIMRGGES